MLQKLVIKNYAIIDKLEIEPDAHFNTLTGETGAGKSIILGALSLILGERADTSVLINKDEKCIVEASFDVSSNNEFTAALRGADIDNDAICIIRREINANGKSRAFINDTPVTLDILNSLTALLVDLQQQFGHLALQDDAFQFDVIDAVAQNNENRKRYSELYTLYKQNYSTLVTLKSQQTQLQKESDYKQFLLNELVEANFQDNEIENAEQQLKQLSHAEKILSVLQASRMHLESGEQPLVNELKRIIQHLQTITEVMPDVSELQQRLTSTWAELKDIVSEIESLESNVSIDEGLMQQLQDRIDLGYKMFKKHAVKDTAGLIDLKQQLEGDLKTGFDLNDSIVNLEAKLKKVTEDLHHEAKILSGKRSDAIPGFERKVNQLLVLVGMPNASVKVIVENSTMPGKFGMDTISFLLDANKSGQFLPIYKAASGGEMSRVMLCIKSITAKAMKMPTLIFDEVDTGISGEAARQVGLLLRELAQYHQVICITHQPQVAAKGTTHFYVYKEPGKDGKIQTRLKTLQHEERIGAIAQMIGGESPSKAAIENAKELIST